MKLEQQTEVNIAAARLLGRECAAEVISQTPDGKWHTGWGTDIFTNAQDLLDVVKVLGTKYRVHLYYDNGWDVCLTRDAYIGVSGTYEEAVSAAVMEVSSGD